MLRKRHKIVIGFSLCCCIAVFVSGRAMKDKPPENRLEVGNTQMMEWDISDISEREEEPQTEVKSRYEEDGAEKMEIDLSYLDNFLGRGKQFVIKRQILQQVGGQAASASCLEYQTGDPDGMRTEFYILLDTGRILIGRYDFASGTSSVEQTDLTEEDVWNKKEEEERDVKEYEEAEKKKAEKRERQKKKKAKAKKEKKADENAQENGA